MISDIRELVPSDLPALQSVDRLQAATGVSQELDVVVSGDVTSPAAITWMSDFKQRVLAEHGFGPDTPNCLAESAELCPGPALSDLFDLSSGRPRRSGPDRRRARRGPRVLLAGDPVAAPTPATSPPCRS